MTDSWVFYRFDHDLFTAVAPRLRSAVTPESLREFARDAETSAVADSAAVGEISVASAHRLLIRLICCAGEPVVFDTGFPALVAHLMRGKGTEDAAAMLGELVAGSHNLDPWLLPAEGLLGFLTPAETAQLCRDLALPIKQFRSASRSGPTHRIISFFRSLLDLGAPAEDMLWMLGKLTEEAVQHGHGLAATAS